MTFTEDQQRYIFNRSIFLTLDWILYTSKRLTSLSKRNYFFLVCCYYFSFFSFFLLRTLIYCQKLESKLKEKNIVNYFYWVLRRMCVIDLFVLQWGAFRNVLIIWCIEKWNSQQKITTLQPTRTTLTTRNSLSEW